MTATTTVPRLPWVALAFSFLSAGVGHVYCGRIAKGLILFCAWFLIPVLTVAAAFVKPSSGVLIGLVLVPAMGIVVLYVYAAIDAFYQARRTNGNYTLKEYNRGIIYLLMILLGLIYPISATSAVKSLVFEAFYIPTSSMSPTIIKGDRILVNKVTQGDKSPQYGDLVVFRNPGAGARVFVKRVVALEGDEVELKSGKVLVNGKPLKTVQDPTEGPRYGPPSGDTYVELNAGRRYRILLDDESRLSESQKKHREMQSLTVPARSVFVLGDHRDRSRDSRNFGVIPVGDILGYPQYIYWPSQSWSRFGLCQD